MVTVTPSDWVLPNRAGYQEWTYRTFHQRYYDAAKKQGYKDRLFPHQQFIRDYMQFKSPYRGLLLFHEVGSGKTCTSLAAAEGFVQRDRKVFVLLPASLEPNYRKEIVGCASIGHLKGRTWQLFPLSVLDKPLIAKNYGLNIKWLKKQEDIWLPTNGEQEKLANGLIEVQPLKSAYWSELTPQQKLDATATLENMVDHRYTFIHYNGVSRASVDKLGRPERTVATKNNDKRFNAFDNSIIVIDETHNFISRVTNGRLIARRIYDLIFEARNAKVVLLSATPVINHPFELAHTINLVRGPITTYEFPLSAKTDRLDKEGIAKLLREKKLLKYVDEYGFNETEDKIVVTLLPYYYDWVNTTNSTKISKIVNKDLVRTTYDLIQQLSLVFGSKVKRTIVTAMPSNKQEFERLFFSSGDNIMNEDLFMRRIQGLVSYFRMTGEGVFPTKTMSQVNVPMTDYQFQEYTKVRKQERDMAERTRKRQRMAQTSSLFEAKSQVYRAFSRMVSNFVFPEWAKRVYPSEIRKEMMKKQMDLTEGDGVVSKEDLDQTEKEEVEDEDDEDSDDDETQEEDDDSDDDSDSDDDEESDDDDDSDEEEDEDSDEEEDEESDEEEEEAVKPVKGKGKVVNDKKASEKDVKRNYAANLTRVMNLLKKKPETLQIDMLKGLYSPKMAALIENVSGSQGPALIYSQFRTCEGLGVLSLALDSCGYTELDVELLKKAGEKEGTWAIKNPAITLAKKYDGRRYVIFPEDRAKQAVILNLYNGNFKALPLAMQKQVSKLDQAHGLLTKAIMITQSGAEGISLKNTRTVHILEAFWNAVRIHQVIGRAMRTYSHSTLPKDEQNVHVYFYVTTFTPKQLESDFTLRRQDNSMTTDEHILTIANRKQSMIDKFYEMMQKASLDCVRNHKANKLTVPCYTVPINMPKNALTYTSQIENERELLTRTRKWTAQPYNRYLVKDEKGNTFDHDAYMAGVQIITKRPANKPTRPATAPAKPAKRTTTTNNGPNGPTGPAAKRVRAKAPTK